MTTPPGRATAAGTMDAASAPPSYFGHERPELAALVPPGTKRVLDVGCAGGALGVALKRRLPSITVTGIDYVTGIVDVARERLDHAVQADLNSDFSLPLPREYYDCIIFGDVLEHLLDPPQTLRRILTHLAPGGVVLASIPNVGHWSLLAPLLGQDVWHYTDEGLLDRTHVHLFTLTEAAQLFAEAGLSEVRLQSIVRLPCPDTHIVRSLAGAAHALGADVDIAQQRLEAYQYLLSAGKPSRTDQA